MLYQHVSRLNFALARFQDVPKWLGLGLLYLVLLSIPDAVLYFQLPNFRPLIPSFLPSGLLALIAPFLWQFQFGCFWLIFYILMSFTGLIYYQYFGVFFSAPDVWLFFVEFRDVMLGMSDLPLGAVISVVLCVLSMLVVLYLRPRFALRRPLNIVWLVLSIFVLSLPVIDVYKQGDHRVTRYYPDNRKSILKNSLNSVFWAVVKIVPGRLFGHGGNQTSYQNYSVSDDTGVSAYPSIVLVMGESLNPDRMGVFGGPNNTTPRLEALLKRYSGVAAYAVSSSVLTRVSIPMFINVVRESDNFEIYRSKTFNLFALAKRRGYKTYFISAQRLDGFSGLIGLQYLDLWHDELSNDGAQVTDENLADYVGRTIVGDNKVFVTVNARVPHAPYKAYVPASKLHFSRESGLHGVALRQVEYDDAMAYFDQVMSDTVEALLNKIKGPVVVVLVSDHGERLGENNGGFGHGVLDFNVGKTPFFYFTRDFRREVGENGRCPQTHYDIGRMIGSLMGFVLENPNDDGMRYLTGHESGDGGRLPYQVKDIPYLKEGCLRFGER